MAIDVKNIRVGYGNKNIIENISLHIPRGSFCTVIGPNGCGKSTLLKAVSRNLPRTGGTVRIDGKPLEQYETKHLARKMAFLAQSPHIPEQFSARELVGYGRYPHTRWLGSLRPEDHRIIDRAMALTGCGDFAERELAHLSGGERQRVWLAMALAQEAEILLLDEPTTYLDISHQLQTLELIRRMNEEMGRTVLMVLHDLNQAARYSDLIFVMKEGRLITRGKPAEVITEEILRDVFDIKAEIIIDGERGYPHLIPTESVND